MTRRTDDFYKNRINTGKPKTLYSSKQSTGFQDTFFIMIRLWYLTDKSEIQEIFFVSKSNNVLHKSNSSSTSITNFT